LADSVTLKFSRGLSITLLVIYLVFLNFQIRSTDHTSPDEESNPYMLADTSSDEGTAIEMNHRPVNRTNKPHSASEQSEIWIHFTAAIILLLSSAGLVSFCAEFMVDAVEHVRATAIQKYSMRLMCPGH